MESDRLKLARCKNCNTVLVRAGTSCHICDADEYFEGAARTSPPLRAQTISSSSTLKSGVDNWKRTA